MKVAVYQTLEDRENPEEVEEHGPYECRGGNSWLGPGYYFWDTHIQLGHWWGDTVYGENYIICKAVLNLDENNCFDIHGNGSHRLEFEETLNGLKKNEVDNDQEITVSRVIAFMKKMPEWEFASIRVLGMNSFIRWSNKQRIYWDEVKFTIGRKPFLDLYPPVQICVISKKDCNLKQWRVVHPDNYVEQFI